MSPSPIPPHHHIKVVPRAVLHIVNLPNARNMVTPPLPHIANSFPLYSNHTVHGVRMRRTSSLLWAKSDPAGDNARIEAWTANTRTAISCALQRGNGMIGAEGVRRARNNPEQCPPLFPPAPVTTRSGRTSRRPSRFDSTRD